MAYLKGGEIDLPIEYMTYLPGKSERRKYFESVLNFYKTEFPNFKLIYAYLTPLSKVYKCIVDGWTYNIDNTFSEKIDYLLIFTVPSKLDNKPIYIIENPLFATTRSCVGFQYCKEQGKLDIFKNMILQTATRIPESRFMEFLYEMSMDELVENYPARLTDPKLAKFYESLPKSVMNSITETIENPEAETVVLDPNAKQFKGVTSLNPDFWKSEENREALLANSIILSMYYNKPQQLA